jgi:hypothetical protein
MSQRCTWLDHDPILVILRKKGIPPLTIKNDSVYIRQQLEETYPKVVIDTFLKFIQERSLAAIQTRSYVLKATGVPNIWKDNPRRDKALKILRNSGLTPRQIRRQEKDVLRILQAAKFSASESIELSKFFCSIKAKQLSSRSRQLKKPVKIGRWTKQRQDWLKILKKAKLSPKIMRTDSQRTIMVLIDGGLSKTAATSFAKFLGQRSEKSIMAACFKFHAKIDKDPWTQMRINGLRDLKKNGLQNSEIVGNKLYIETQLINLKYDQKDAEDIARFLASKTSGAIATQNKIHGFADKKRSGRIKAGIKSIRMTDEQHEIFLTFIRRKIGTLDYHDIANDWNNQFGVQGYPKVNYDRVYRFVKRKLKKLMPTRSQTYRMKSTQDRRKRMAKERSRKAHLPS